MFLLNPYRVTLFICIITQGCDTFSILPWAKLFIPFRDQSVDKVSISEFLVSFYKKRSLIDLFKLKQNSMYIHRREEFGQIYSDLKK